MKGRSDVFRRSYLFCVYEGPPCRAGSFLYAQKGTKDALGVDSGERLRAAGAHSHLPPRPPVTGDTFLVSW